MQFITRDRLSLFKACVSASWALKFASNSLVSISDQVSSSPWDYLTSLVVALATLLHKDLRKKYHLDFPYRKVEAIRLGWGLNAITNESHVCETKNVMGQI